METQSAARLLPDTRPQRGLDACCQLQSHLPKALLDKVPANRNSQLGIWAPTGVGSNQLNRCRVDSAESTVNNCSESHQELS